MFPFEAKTIAPSERENWLYKHVPYRIQILRGLAIYNEQRGPNGPLLPVFPCIFEASLVICRWTANFLGLKFDRRTRTLRRPREREDDDVFVFDLGGTLIDPAELLPEEQALLISVLEGANKASAHATIEGSHSMTPGQVKPAAALMIGKIKTHLYDVLRMQVPEWNRGH